METKLKVTLHLTKEAVDLMLDGGFASQRTMGAFISDLLVTHCSKQPRTLTPAEIAAELRRLAALLDDRTAS